MLIEMFSLCDAATIESGKLNILGAFDVITAPKLPAIHPQCAVALRFRFNAIDGTSHKISVKFVDADGQYLISPTEGMVKINFQEGQRTSSANLVLNIQGLKFEQFGEYAIDLGVDGKNQASIPLFVKERPESNKG